MKVKRKNTIFWWLRNQGNRIKRRLGPIYINRLARFELVRYFGGDVQTWMNLQTTYEIKVASKERAKRIAREVVPMTA